MRIISGAPAHVARTTRGLNAPRGHAGSARVAARCLCERDGAGVGDRVRVQHEPAHPRAPVLGERARERARAVVVQADVAQPKLGELAHAPKQRREHGNAGVAERVAAEPELLQRDRPA